MKLSEGIFHENDREITVDLRNRYTQPAREGPY
jgi:hypothetical protein